MKVSRVNSLRSAIFTVPLFAMALNVAMAAPQTGNRSTSPNNSITAEQIAAAQNKVATALAIANRFTAQSVAGSGGPDPNRVQLINNLLTGDAKGLEEAGAAARFQVTLRDEAVVAGHDGERRHAVQGGEAADRGHAATRSQLLVVDPAAHHPDDLVGQRFARIA